MKTDCDILKMLRAAILLWDYKDNAWAIPDKKLQIDALEYASDAVIAMRQRLSPKEG